MENKCGPGYGETGTFVCCWWECKMVQSQQNTIWQFLKKSNIKWAPWLGISVSYSIVPICQAFRFNFWSRHIQETTNECIISGTAHHFSLSPSLSLKINKFKTIKNFFKPHSISIWPSDSRSETNYLMRIDNGICSVKKWPGLPCSKQKNFKIATAEY